MFINCLTYNFVFPSPREILGYPAQLHLVLGLEQVIVPVLEPFLDQVQLVRGAIHVIKPAYPHHQPIPLRVRRVFFDEGTLVKRVFVSG